MATSAGIAGVAKSIERLLTLRFAPDEPTTGTTPTLAVLANADLIKNGPTMPGLTIYLYRIEVNRTMRPAWSAVGHHDGVGHLPLDLHFLLTAWATDAEDELRILGRAMELLDATPILTGPLLHSLNENMWSGGESIQLLADDVPSEAVLRIFDLWPAKHKLSVSYLARVMRLDTRPERPDLPAGTIVTGLVPSLTP